MPAQALPEPDEVRELFHGLLGRDVTVSRAHPESIAIDARVITASYLRDDDSVAGVVVADLTIAAYLGAALSLLPKVVADENVSEGSIQDNLLENYREVLNVGASWFNAKGNPHASLGNVYEAGVRPPQDVAVVMGGPVERLDLDVEVAGYGKGKLRLLVTSW